MTSAVITENKSESAKYMELLLYLSLSKEPVARDMTRLLDSEELLEKVMIIDPTFGFGFYGNEWFRKKIKAC